MIPSPREESETEELNDAILEIPFLTGALVAESGNSIKRAVLEEALEAADSEAAREQASRALRKTQVSLPETRDAAMTRSFRKSPQEIALTPRTAAEEMAAFLGREKPATPEQTYETYLAHLDWLFQQGQSETGTVEGQSLGMDFKTLRPEQLISLLEEAEYVLAADSQDVRTMKQVLSSKLAGTEKNAANFNTLWKQWRKGYVDDAVMLDWLLNPQIQSLQAGLDQAPAAAKDLARYLSWQPDTDHAGMVRSIANMVDLPQGVNFAGPATLGKGTAAQTVASNRGWQFFDAGPIYRAYAAQILKAIEEGVISLSVTLDQALQAL